MRAKHEEERAEMRRKKEEREERERKQREKDDAAKMAHLLRDNAKIAMECERIQQDMERQAMELEESRIQIQRGKEQYENAVREGQDKLRLLNERLTGQLRNKDAASTEQEAQVEVLTQDLNKARDEVKQAMQRVLDLETELKHAKSSFHDLHQKNDDQQRLQPMPQPFKTGVQVYIFHFSAGCHALSFSFLPLPLLKMRPRAWINTPNNEARTIPQPA